MRLILPIKVCPLTFVKAKVAIEELEDGEILAVRMNDGEPVQNVPRSMKEEGHKVLKLTDNEEWYLHHVCKKGGRLMAVRVSKTDFEEKV